MGLSIAPASIKNLTYLIKPAVLRFAMATNFVQLCADDTLIYGRQAELESKNKTEDNSKNAEKCNDPVVTRHFYLVCGF